ncbi:arginine deiminase-related protein [Oxalobacteraceae bacterium R-40]|uniref:arginine deiminase n=1 Tax=Keguizhuia sedimenti TaxID=3064264 RepID=A0ABU1BK58_9BURK|nr:arginine deiminase-related protein [Oxalobacteraceae bacterium R-40]
MTDRFFMCAPRHFEVAYVINPWMEGNIAHGNNKKAMRQWNALARAIGKLARIECIPAEAGVPDMVFTANAGLVLENKVVLSRFRHAQRRLEEPYFEKWFAEQGFHVLTLPPDMPFEGAGDALLDRRLPLLWMGYGHRSDFSCAALLSEKLEIEVQTLKLVNSRFYHLDTCFCPLEGGYLMYHPAAFDAASQAQIAARIPAEYRIPVSAADAFEFACNAVNSGRNIFLNHASPALTNELQSRGFIVHQTPLSEFMKAGGAAKCLTLKLTEPRKLASQAAA